MGAKRNMLQLEYIIFLGALFYTRTGRVFQSHAVLGLTTVDNRSRGNLNTGGFFSFGQRFEMQRRLGNGYEDSVSSSISPGWESPPYLAILTEPDACLSSQRMDETMSAMEEATLDAGVDLVVMRVVETFADKDDPKSKEINSTIDERKWELLQRLADLKRRRNNGGFLLVVNDDVELAMKAVSNRIPLDGIHVKERNAQHISDIREKFSNLRRVIIGTSCHSLESASKIYNPQRPSFAPDYMFVGTCYLTQSHPEKSLSELEGPTLPGKVRREMHHLFHNAASSVQCSKFSSSENINRNGPNELRPKSNVIGEGSPFLGLAPPPKIFAIGGIHEHNCHEPVLTYGAEGVATIRAVMQARDPREVVSFMKSSMGSNEATQLDF